MDNPSESNGVLSEAVEQEPVWYNITGKGFRTKFIGFDLIFLAGLYFLLKAVFFRFEDAVINDHPFVYWGTLIGASFALYMGTFRVLFQHLAISNQFLSCVEKHLDDSLSANEIAEITLELQNTGKYSAENSQGDLGPVAVSYNVLPSGVRLLVFKWPNPTAT